MRGESNLNIIDTRCRPCTEEWVEWLKLPFQRYHVSRLGAFYGTTYEIQTPKDLIQEMDDAGVSVGIVAGRDAETTLGWKWNYDKVFFRH